MAVFRAKTGEPTAWDCLKRSPADSVAAFANIVVFAEKSLKKGGIRRHFDTVPGPSLYAVSLSFCKWKWYLPSLPP